MALMTTSRDAYLAYSRAWRGAGKSSSLGDGLTLTHTVHVDDVASAFAAVPGKGQALGQVYNAAGPEAITFRGYANAIASIMGVDARIVHVEIRDYEAMREELGPLRSVEVFDYGWRE